MASDPYSAAVRRWLSFIQPGFYSATFFWMTFYSLTFFWMGFYSPSFY